MQATLIFGLFSTFHIIITFTFFLALARAFLCKYAPYSLFYIASVLLLQSVYNGCPFMDVQNFLARQAQLAPDPNQFMFGFFGEYTFLFRIILFLCAVFFYTISYKTWDKAEVRYDFKRMFR